MTVPMFKGLFGSKEKKVQEGYVPPSVASLETAGVADGVRAGDTSASESSSSAFSFMSSAPVTETAAAPSSAFGFIASGPSVAPVQPPAPTASAAAPAPASGFSFIHDAPVVHAAPSSSGFSFIQDAPVASSDAAEVDPKILEENMRVAGLKKVVKKRSMARKPGQAVHDDDDPPATSSQRQSTPVVTDLAKASASVDHLNQVAPPVVSSAAPLSSLAEHEKSEEPAFSFISASAGAESVTQPSTLPTFTAANSANVANPIMSIQQDSDGDNSDGGGLDLDGMIIHEVVPELCPPPVHQPQPQHQSSLSSLQDWVEMRDDASGKMCVYCSYFRRLVCSHAFTVTIKIMRPKLLLGTLHLAGPIIETPLSHLAIRAHFRPNQLLPYKSFRPLFHRQTLFMMRKRVLKDLKRLHPKCY